MVGVGGKDDVGLVGVDEVEVGFRGCDGDLFVVGVVGDVDDVIGYGGVYGGLDGGVLGWNVVGGGGECGCKCGDGDEEE